MSTRKNANYLGREAKHACRPTFPGCHASHHGGVQLSRPEFTRAEWTADRIGQPALGVEPTERELLLEQRRSGYLCGQCACRCLAPNWLSEAIPHRWGLPRPDCLSLQLSAHQLKDRAAQGAEWQFGRSQGTGTVGLRPTGHPIGRNRGVRVSRHRDLEGGVRQLLLVLDETPGVA